MIKFPSGECDVQHIFKCRQYGQRNCFARGKHSNYSVIDPFIKYVYCMRNNNWGLYRAGYLSLYRAGSLRSSWCKPCGSTMLPLGCSSCSCNCADKMKLTHVQVIIFHYFSAVA